MKVTLFLAAAALTRVAYTSPIQYRDFDEIDDDECGAPEPEPTSSSSASTPTASVLSSSAAASPSSVPTSGSSSSKATGSGPNPYTSNGIKAGLSGFQGIATNDQSGFNALAVS